MKTFWNPYTTYSAACLFVVLVYSMGFSYLYPDLTTNVIGFLAFAVGSSIVFSLVVSRNSLSENPLRFGQTGEWFLVTLFAAGFAAEFAYFGGIPLVQALRGADVDYLHFGIPTFHVVLVGFCFFFSVFWWDSYLASKDRRFLLISSAGFVASVLMLSRGGALIQIIAFIFAYGNRIGLRRKALLIAIFFAAVVLGFGYLGEVRMGTQGANLLLSIGGANDRFFSSKLPDSTFWFYIYVSSPLANLQYTDLNGVSDSFQWIGVIADFLPDWISHHFISTEDFEAIATMRIANELTVGTAYARPLRTIGWEGAYALHATFLLFSYFAICTARRTRYHGAVLAILCAQGCLMFFDNMVVFSGALNPILVGLVLSAWQKISSTASPSSSGAGESAPDGIPIGSPEMDAS